MAQSSSSQVKEINMKKIVATLLAATLAASTPIVFARAGTLIKCNFVSTNQGARYIGTYCVDFACQYTTTRVFTSYCPYSI